MPSKPKSAAAGDGPRGSSCAQKTKAGDPSAAAISAADLRALLESQQYRCALTGRELTPATAAFDYRTPLPRGGRYAPENAHVIHVDANRAKGTLTVKEFVQLCREIVAWADRPTGLVWSEAEGKYVPRWWSTHPDAESDAADQV